MLPPEDSRQLLATIWLTRFHAGIGGDVYAITTLTKDEVQALPEHHD